MGRVQFIRAAVDAAAEGRPEPHDIGWLPSEGWFCTTCGNGRCEHIQQVSDAAKEAK